MARSRLALPVDFRRRHFTGTAKPIALSMGGVVIGDMHPRQHTTGSLGWRLDTKAQFKIGDYTVWVQITGAAIILGSKDLPVEAGQFASVPPRAEEDPG